MEDKKAEERLKEIIRIASNLGWITTSNTECYTMQISEVEKCMLAMVDDTDLQLMRKWDEEKAI